MYTVALQDAGLGGGGVAFVGEVFTSVKEITKSASNSAATIITQREQQRQFDIQKEASTLFHVPGQSDDALTRALAMAGSGSAQTRMGSAGTVPKKGLPAWAWALIGVGGVSVLGAAAWMAFGR